MFPFSSQRKSGDDDRFFDTPLLVVNEDEGTSAQSSKATLADSRGLWTSDEEAASANILDRFLKVQQYQNLKVASMDSDGLPSIAPVDESEAEKMSELLSEFSEAEDMTVASSVARDRFLNATVSDLEEEEDDYEPPTVITDPKPVSPAPSADESASVVSAESLILPAKREAMDQFEKTLRDMIQEAREMAKTPAKEESDHELDLSRYANTLQFAFQPFLLDTSSPRRRKRRRRTSRGIRRPSPARPRASSPSSRQFLANQHLPFCPAKKTSKRPRDA